MKKIISLAITFMLVVSVFTVLLPKVKAFSYPYLVEVGISYESTSTAITPPITQTPGGHMRLWYHTYNPNSYSVDVILGASINIGSSYYDDPSNDKVVTLSPGDDGYSRYFYVPSGVPTGSYTVIYAIWATDWSVRYDIVSKSGWINMVSSVSVGLSSSPSNIGTITWDSVTYSLPKTVYTTTRIHWSGWDDIHCTPPSGYDFHHWESTGAVDPWDEYSQWTNVDVEGSGSLKAVFTAIPIPPSLTLGDPAITDRTVTINGAASPGTAGTTITRIHWNWNDGYSEDHWFPATHTYASYGDYTITVTAYQSDGLSTTKTKFVSLEPDERDLGVLPKLQHKDTSMLCLEGCPLTGVHAWNVEHQSRGCLHDDRYCVRASISMINSYYGGDLSQDRISFYVMHERNLNTVPENDLGHGRGLYPAETYDGLSWALNGATISHQVGKPTFAQIEGWIDSGRPILRRDVSGDWHSTVIDGYEGAGQRVHIIDPWTGTETSVAYSTLAVYEIWVPPAGATARSDESSINLDSDGDGVIDFDEINRFGTDPFDPDTDNDLVPDKQEITSYTFLSDGSFDAGDTRKPDLDNDGLRCELDMDSDNGGVSDGQEDLNGNGFVESGETDPLNPSDDPNSVHLESSQDNAASSNLGSIVFDGSTHSLPNDIIKTAGTYSISYNPASGYVFDHWETTDGVSVADPNAPSTTATVNGDGTLRAIYNACMHAGDVNNDGIVDVADLAIIGLAYGSSPGDPNWNLEADLNVDGTVNLFDLLVVAVNFGRAI